MIYIYLCYGPIFDEPPLVYFPLYSFIYLHIFYRFLFCLVLFNRVINYIVVILQSVFLNKLKYNMVPNVLLILLSTTHSLHQLLLRITIFNINIPFIHKYICSWVVYILKFFHKLPNIIYQNFSHSNLFIE